MLGKRTPHVATLSALFLLSCGDNLSARPPATEGLDIYNVASGCFTLDIGAPGKTSGRWLVRKGEEAYRFAAGGESDGEVFALRAADLGTYLLYDSDGYFVVGTDEGLLRHERLESSVELVDDSFVSPAEWEFQSSSEDDKRFVLRHLATGKYLGTSGLVASEGAAGVVGLYPAQGCAEIPEMSLDATGAIAKTTWEDGDVYGIVDTHSHLLSNFGFGGGGIVHGAPFHRLGVEHALSSCRGYHGAQGRRDIIGFGFSGFYELSIDDFLSIFVTGRTPEPNHDTDGYPNFPEWPNSWKHATHQMQYYRWLERAYLGGLRLVVQHATTNSVLCELVVGIGSQRVRYSCNDMVNVDRQIEEAYNMERYIDAQHGGPGKGWFRLVGSPAEAREVIESGKLAVVLGIETSNIFDCFLTPPEGFERCSIETVRAKLDEYYERGVRVVFPVHKLDNGFSAGDGDRRVGQLASWVNSGHFSNFVLEDCPSSPSVFDKGDVTFGGLNEPRDEYDSPPQTDMSGFADAPLDALSPFLDRFQEPPLVGDYCQKTGLTSLGEALVGELMQRGMLIEVDHMPRRSFDRAYELLGANDYPPIGSHGNTNEGKVYELGGVSKLSLLECAEEGQSGSLAQNIRDRVALIEANGGYPGVGFGFDFNGFAGGRRPRFGDESPCTAPQENPVEHPFDSFAGDVSFEAPQLGTRAVDFNREGMLHLGLMPEIIEDLRRDGASDSDIEPLFRSAEAYLRMWEKAEARGAALRSAREP